MDAPHVVEEIVRQVHSACLDPRGTRTGGWSGRHGADTLANIVCAVRRKMRNDWYSFLEIVEKNATSW